MLLKIRTLQPIFYDFFRAFGITFGYVTYRRRKTGQRLTIEWTKEMQTLLDKYPAN